MLASATKLLLVDVLLQADTFAALELENKINILHRIFSYKIKIIFKIQMHNTTSGCFEVKGMVNFFLNDFELLQTKYHTPTS